MNSSDTASKKSPRPLSELPSMLYEHLDMLMSFCKSYDEGKPYFAAAISINLRVLLHEKLSKKNHALLFQLKPKELEFCDTEKAMVGGDPMCFMPNAGMTMGPVKADSQKMAEEWFPTLDMKEIRAFRTRFDYWWNDEILAMADSRYSRKMIVDAICNKDGGGHVDTHLAQAYFDLTRLNQTGTWRGVSSGISDNSSSEFVDSEEEIIPLNKDGSGMMLARSVLRQIAHEVVLTLVDDPANYLAETYKTRTSRELLIFEFKAVDPLPRRHHWNFPT